MCTWTIAPEMSPLSRGKCLSPGISDASSSVPSQEEGPADPGSGGLLAAGAAVCSLWWGNLNRREGRCWELDQLHPSPTPRDTLTDTGGHREHGGHEHNCTRSLRSAQPWSIFKSWKRNLYKCASLLLHCCLSPCSYLGAASPGLTQPVPTDHMPVPCSLFLARRQET